MPLSAMSHIQMFSWHWLGIFFFFLTELIHHPIVVIIYSLSWRSKPVEISFFCRTQKETVFKTSQLPLWIVLSMYGQKLWKVIQVWNSMKVSKNDKMFIFGWTIPFIIYDNFIHIPTAIKPQKWFWSCMMRCGITRWRLRVDPHTDANSLHPFGNRDIQVPISAGRFKFYALLGH